MTSTDMSLDCDHESSLETEVETLHAVYIDELKIEQDSQGRPTTITIQLHPATADNTEEQYVCLTLILNLPKEYPEEIPEIIIRNPRGLSDIELESIKNDLKAKATQRKNGPMLYELIELAKEHLTLGNTPSCECAVCLYGFNDHDIFIRTKCYHYFHSYCLSRYVTHTLHQAKEAEKGNPRHRVSEKLELEVGCPVCRLPIRYEMLLGKEFPPPTELEKQLDFTLTPKLKKQQTRMRSLYHKQKAKGGIIDVDAERNKYLIEISTVSEPPSLSLGSSTDLERKNPIDVADEESSEQDCNRSRNIQPKHTIGSTLGSAVDNASRQQSAAPKSGHRKQGRNRKPRVYSFTSADSSRIPEDKNMGKEHQLPNGTKIDSTHVSELCIPTARPNYSVERHKQITLETEPCSYVNGISEPVQHRRPWDSVAARNEKPRYYCHDKRPGRRTTCGMSQPFNRDADRADYPTSENMSVPNISHFERLQGNEKPPGTKYNRTNSIQNSTGQLNCASQRHGESRNKSRNSSRKASIGVLSEHSSWANNEYAIPERQPISVQENDVITNCISMPTVPPPPGFAVTVGPKPLGKPPPGFFRR